MQQAVCPSPMEGDSPAVILQTAGNRHRVDNRHQAGNHRQAIMIRLDQMGSLFSAQ
jgi:hypothetical protein